MQCSGSSAHILACASRQAYEELENLTPSPRVANVFSYNQSPNYDPKAVYGKILGCNSFYVAWSYNTACSCSGL